MILYNQDNGSGGINLPPFVQDRLFYPEDTTNPAALLYPPSQLSLFGTDFTMQAGWLIDFPAGVTADEEITLTYTTQSYTATHGLSGTTLSASLQTSTQASQAQYTSAGVNLSTYSLNPIMGSATGAGAAIGFTATPIYIHSSRIFFSL